MTSNFAIYKPIMTSTDESALSMTSVSKKKRKHELTKNSEISYDYTNNPKEHTPTLSKCLNVSK